MTPPTQKPVSGRLLPPSLAVPAAFLVLATLVSCSTTAQKVTSKPELFVETAVRRRRSPELETRLVRKIMRTMTLHQKIGQRFICWIEGTEVSAQAAELARQGAAGIILYPWNIEDPGQVRELTASLQRAARESDPPIGFFISVDQEGGRVAAFRFRETTKLAPAFYWGRYEDPRYVKAVAYIVGREIRELGCNMNFAPVLDLYGTADATIIGDRSLGIDPRTVGKLGTAYLKGARQAQIIPVIKHFPGHGSSTVDSHGRLPVVDIPEDQLLQRDFMPFRIAIQAGAEALMTAHVLFPQIDPQYPATLSKRVLRDLLRERFGFEGVIVSDGMAMGALAENFTVADTLKLMIEAGLDLILVHSRYDLVELKLEMLRLLYNGEITEAQIDEGVERILRLKLRYGLLAD
ncbi:MAG: beta-N-acetylhexosaminidase [Spirochaetaceae bacterium]|nr:MAG: beta-N-acetylhexosaminidase [Spirochaetaceae bacterium]